MIHLLSIDRSLVTKRWWMTRRFRKVRMVCLDEM